ncbi:MAG: SDR family oxidoreductase [SAR86 cluster bacterium]|jgi:NAD(P)-dependent dehydrogenase (short-subunit alcohol dehydrogenase family)|nr:SDR family oxidoreductase [SAR86 cluster bacterium]
MDNIFSVKGKVAIVTGGSRGVGLMIAKAFVKSGAKVYISSRDGEVCESIAKELSKDGTCESIPTDLSNQEGVISLAESFKLKEDKLDILVNNAGKTWGSTLKDYPIDKWDMVMKVNVGSPFHLIKELHPLLKISGSKEDPSRIINIGSPAAVLGSSLGAYAYNASKAAIHHLTRVLAKEFAKDNININTISPGPFPSKMTEFDTGDGVSFLDRAGQGTPIGRHGTEDDMMATSLFMASKASSYITGATIPLDGGVHLG